MYTLLTSLVYTAQNHELLLQLVNQTRKDLPLQLPCENKAKQKTHWRNGRTCLTPVNKEHTLIFIFTTEPSSLRSGSSEMIQLLYGTETALTLKVTFAQTLPTSCLAMTIIYTGMYTYTINKHICGKTSVPCPGHVDNSV